ncbi:MAG: family 4 glycosyl hydrolase [Anaerolineae bacterium]
MDLKISIIGAGSASFSLSMIRDICLTPSLAGSTISFMDIDPRRLDAAYTICQRYAAELGVKLKLEKTLDRRESLQGADFVINTALSTGHAPMKAGWEISLRHGYHWGASFHIMYDEPFYLNYYQFRFFESVTEDMLEICPQAWHLLVANPVLAGVTHITRKYPEARIVGLCHGFGDIYHVAETLGLGSEGLTYEIPGVNHFVWLTHCYSNGQDVFPLLDRWIEAEYPKLEAEGKLTRSLSKKRIDLYKRFGVLPIGDTATWTGASWPVWYHSDDATERQWGEAPESHWFDYNRHVGQIARDSLALSEDSSVKLVDRFPRKVTGEPMIPIIESMACDIPRVIIGNISNRGDLVPGIPSDFEVEVPLLVSKRGIEGVRTQGLPPAIVAHAIHDRVIPVNIELEAYKTGSRELLMQLIMMDPWSRSEAQAAGLLAEISAMPALAEFAAHYR